MRRGEEKTSMRKGGGAWGKENEKLRKKKIRPQISPKFVVIARKKKKRERRERDVPDRPGRGAKGASSSSHLKDAGKSKKRNMSKNRREKPSCVGKKGGLFGGKRSIMGVCSRNRRVEAEQKDMRRGITSFLRSLEPIDLGQIS